jgi:TonB family protein
MRILAATIVISLAAVARMRAENSLPPVNTHPTEQIPAQHIRVAASREQFDVPPKFISGAAPIYPITRLRLGEAGYAVIRFTVDEAGHTRDFQIVTTSYPYFAKHAIAAVQKWQFQPAMEHGGPVSCRIEAPFFYRVAR